MLCRTLEELQREAHVTRLDLRPLSRGATGDLVRLLVHSGLAASDVARLAEQIWHTSEGNPFVVVETIRALDQEVVTSGSTALSLPERVRQLIARRLDRLTESSRQLLAVAAIIGREFEFALVQRAAGVDEGEAAEAIEELVRRHLLEVVGDRFDFTHDRIREAVRRGLLPPRHKLLSRRVAEAIEAHHASNLEPHHLALASHYRDGEVWEQAVHHFRQAGTRATARSASREAVACFEQALAALGHLPPSRDTREHAIDLRFEMRRPLGLLGETGRLLEVLREAEALALGLGDQSRLRQVTGHMTACRIVMGDLEGAVESGERALSLAAAARDFGLQVMANFELGRAYTGLGKFRRAIGAFGQNIEMLRGELVREHFGMPNLPAIMSRIWVGGCLARLGEFGAASASATEAIRLAETLDHPSSLVAAYMTLGQVHLAQDDLAAAIPSLERSLELCQKVSFAFQFPALARDLGRAYSRAGRVADGLLLVQRAAEQSASMRLGAIHASCLSALGEIHLRAGRSAEALRSVQQALDLFRVTKQRGAEAEAEWILGDIRSARAPSGLEEAEAAYRQSLSLANELGMRPLMARCHLSHGRLCRLAGRAPEAREHVATATTMFREMGMRRGVEDAEAEMRLVG
jgi:tetratricopeptide (TPR) repeat protein